MRKLTGSSNTATYPQLADNVGRQVACGRAPAAWVGGELITGGGPRPTFGVEKLESPSTTPK